MQLRVLFFAGADEPLRRRRAGALAFASARGQFLFGTLQCIYMPSIGTEAILKDGQGAVVACYCYCSRDCSVE